MVMVREVLNCRPGQVGALVSKFKALGEVMQAMGHEPFRLYTDVAGEDFWTLVLERDFDSVDAAMALEGEVMSNPDAQAAMQGYHDHILRGRREIYKVES